MFRTHNRHNKKEQDDSCSYIQRGTKRQKEIECPHPTLRLVMNTRYGRSVIIGFQKTQIYQRFAGSRQGVFILKILEFENNAAQQDNGRRCSFLNVGTNCPKLVPLKHGPGGISPVAAYRSEQPGAVCQGCITPMFIGDLPLTGAPGCSAFCCKL